MPLTTLSLAQPALSSAIETLVDLLEQACATHQKPDALQVKRNGVYQPISSEQLRDSVDKVAGGLAALGVRKGDRVALLSENRPEWAISDQGILSIGAINVPFYATLPAAQISELLLDSEACVIIVSTQIQLDKVLGISSRVPTLKHIVVMDPLNSAPEHVMPFPTLLDIGRKAVVDNDGVVKALRQNVYPDDTASIIY